MGLQQVKREIEGLKKSTKYTEIAKELNITVQTLWNYRQSADFNREFGKLAARENRLRMETRLGIVKK